jgi:type III secretory pathway component EscV
LEAGLERPLHRSQIEQLYRAILPHTQASPLSPGQDVILTQLQIRRYLFELIRKEFPQVAVLAYQELSPDLNIQCRERIVLPPTAEEITANY